MVVYSTDYNYDAYIHVYVHTGSKMVRGGLFGPGSGQVYSVTINESGAVITTLAGKSHNDDAGLFCLGMCIT